MNGYTGSYSYDGLNRMTGAVFNGATVATLSYDPLSRRTGVVFGDGSSQAYGYDAADRLTSLSHVFPNGPGSNVSFAYGYDGAGRTTSATISNPAFVNSPLGQSTIPYAAADALNRYPSVNGQAFAYWQNGELYQDGTYSHYFSEAGPHTLSYVNAGGVFAVFMPKDALGRAFQHQGYRVATSDFAVEYQSVAGDRSEVIEDRFLTSPDNANFSYVGDREYVLGPEPDERLYYADINGTGYYPHVDRQGSTIALSTAGQDVLTRTYGPYGEIQQPVTAVPGASAYPYLYTGQYYLSVIGAYDYKARTYSPTQGRFLNPDPIGPADDINLYGYTHNDPVNGSDPLGTCTGSNISNPDGSCGDGSSFVTGAGSSTGTPDGKKGLGGSSNGAFQIAQNGQTRGIGDNGGPPLDPEEPGLGGARAGALGALLSLTGDTDTRTKTDAIIEDHLTPRDLDAARRELGGEVVARRWDGTPFNHVQEVQDAQRGLRNRIIELKSWLSRPGTPDGIRQQWQNELGKASRALDSSRGWVP